MLLPEQSFTSCTELSVAEENASPVVQSRAKSECLGDKSPEINPLPYLPHIFFSLPISSQVV